MPDRSDIHLYNESIRIAGTYWSDFSTQQSLSIATDPTIPSAPTITATDAAGAVAITITAPSTNTDGTTITDIKEYSIYYDPTDGIDVTDSGTYTGTYKIAATAKLHPATAQTYFKATCWDKWGNESAGSNEANGSPTGIAPENDGLWAHRLGKDATWTENTPAGGVTWADVVLYWKDNAYTITNGDTTNKYLWWDYSLSTTTFQETDTLPALTYEDVLVAYNDSGALYLVLYSPMVIADYMRAGVLQSTNWAAAVGSQLDLDAGTIVLGGSDENGFVAAADGSLALGTSFIWDASIVDLTVQGSVSTDSAGALRVSMVNDVLDIEDTNQYDRIKLATGALTMKDASNVTIGYLPTTSADSTRAANPYFVHNRVNIDNVLVVGTNTDPTLGSNKLYVSGAAEITGTLTLGSALVAIDHGAAATDQVVNVCYGTGSPPTASTTTEGTLWVKYTA